ncbi:MAG: glycosyltransferase [Clostridia bacterium]|nr:glycosyltransferase [Clostridia bacterium]
MKLLFYISTIRGGGAARVMVNIANEMAKKGHSVLFVTNFPDEHEYILSDGIDRRSIEPTESKAGKLKKNFTRIRALRRIIKDEKPDVSVAFMRENNFRLLLAAKGLKTKTIVSVRCDPAREYASKLSRTLANLLYRKAGAVVFQTEDARAFFPNAIQKRSQIIFNQVDDRFFALEKEPGDYIAACGRLSNQKNYPMMLRAFAEVLKEYPNEELRIYGDGEQLDALSTLAKELGIADSVRLMGFSSDVPGVLQKAKFLAMSSDYEGLPNAVLESLAAGIPVVSTDCPCGGPRMVICDGENGYLVPVGDDKAMAEKMKALLSDEGRLAAMGKTAKEGAKAYRGEQVIETWESLFETV